MHQPDDSNTTSLGRDSRSVSSSILRLAQAGDKKALSWLFTTFAEMVYALARSNGLQEHDASDIVNDVFAAVVENIDRFRRENPGDTFKGWLWRIAQNKINDYFRRQGKTPPAAGGSQAQWKLNQIPVEWNSDDSGQHSSNEPTNFIIIRRVLERVQGEFEERTWQAFWRTTIDKQKAADVGDELGMTPAAVYKAKSRVLRRVREELRGLTDI